MAGREGRLEKNGTAKITVFFGPGVMSYRAELVPKELRNFPWLNLSLSRLTLAITEGGIRCKSGVGGKSLTKIIDDVIGNTTINEKINDGISCVSRITNIADPCVRKRANLIEAGKIGLDLLE